jgi:hypothetical protein
MYPSFSSTSAAAMRPHWASCSRADSRLTPNRRNRFDPPLLGPLSTGPGTPLCAAIKKFRFTKPQVNYRTAGDYRVILDKQEKFTHFFFFC